MEKIIGFISSHKYLIMVLIFVIILSYFGHKDIKIEHLDDNKMGKEIYLKYNDGSNDYYLAILSKDKCRNIDEKTVFECFYNIAILRDTPDRSCRFIISSKLGSSPVQYKLHSSVENITPYYAHMSQNINDLPIKSDSEVPLCFDDGEDHIIYFYLEESNQKKYKIIFGKGNINYYVALCQDKSCTQNDINYKRLCLTGDKTRAIEFELVIAPYQKIQEKQKEADTEELMKYYKERVKRDTDTDIDSKIELFSLDGVSRYSDESNIIEIPGIAEPMIDSGNFAKWE